MKGKKKKKRFLIKLEKKECQCGRVGS
jgi:hypothetical protein